MVLTVLLTGCGTSYTKADFIARADAICAAALRDTRSIPPPAGQQLTDLSDYASRVLKIQRHEQSALAALPLPPQSTTQAALLRQFLAAGKKVEQDYAGLVSAARRNNLVGVTGAEAALRALPFSALAGRYGLRTCGSAGATVR